jgi:hypothetical protein
MMVCELSVPYRIDFMFTKTYPEAVGNNEHSGSPELLVHNSADLGIGGRVNACCGFIKDEDPVLLQKSTSKDNKLLLARRQAVDTSTSTTGKYFGNPIKLTSHHHS